MQGFKIIQPNFSCKFVGILLVRSTAADPHSENFVAGHAHLKAHTVHIMSEGDETDEGVLVGMIIPK